jgi:acyl carrier protein
MNDDAVSRSERDGLADEVIDVLCDVMDEPAAAFEDEPRLGAYESWNSLGTLRVLTQIEARVGLRLDLREFHAVRTVDDLVDLVGRAHGDSA